jgi:glycosyltransferase involved in cell wall biosynthesis
MRIAVHDYAGHPFPFELSRELAARGHTVGHFYFAGDIGPKGESVRRADDPAGFSVTPILTTEPYSKTDLIRRRRGDILYGAAAAARLRAFRPDVILSGNSPLHAQARLIDTARAVEAAFVFWVQDLYGLAATRLLGARAPGAGHLLGAWYQRLEAELLNASDGIVAISPDFAPAMRRIGVQRPGAVVENWGALSALPPRPKDNAWRRRNALQGRFVFLYSGTMALKHDPATLWALADAFRGQDEVRVVAAVSGVRAEALRARQAADPHPNLIVLPLQPVAQLADMLGAADVLVAQLEAEAGQFSVPSKVLSYLCAGRPILLAAPVDNLATRTVQAAGAGLCVASRDVPGLVAAARRLHSDEAMRQRCGEAGRAYAERAFAIGPIADRFEAILTEARDAVLVPGVRPRRLWRPAPSGRPIVASRPAPDAG